MKLAARCHPSSSSRYQEGWARSISQPDLPPPPTPEKHTNDLQINVRLWEHPDYGRKSSLRGEDALAGQRGGERMSWQRTACPEALWVKGQGNKRGLGFILGQG